MKSAQNTTIHFSKASACGNDFLIVAGSEVGGDLSAVSRRLCDRHNGVGADGVEWLFPDAAADAMARLINADGSEAEISGNGTRCVAAEICSRSEKREVVIRTGAGLKTCRLIGQRGATFEFETDMGAAVVGEQLAIEREIGARHRNASFDRESAFCNSCGGVSAGLARAGSADSVATAISAGDKCGVCDRARAT